MSWMPDRLLRVLLYWTAVTTLVFWLPFVRGAFDGPTYEWGLSAGLHGAGVHGDYWLPALGSALALATLWLGWRGARLPFHILLVLWHGALAALVTAASVVGRGELRLRGDTLGIDVPLDIAGPVLFGAVGLTALYWAARDLRARRPHTAPPWTRANTVRLAGLAALLPIQFLTLRLGAPAGGPLDPIGVLLTIAQWLALGWAIRPRPALSAPAGERARPRTPAPTSSGPGTP